MKTRFLICLGIILIIFIILNYCVGKKEKFIVPDPIDIFDLNVNHTETFNIKNFLDYFLDIHKKNMNIDTINKKQTSELNNKIIGGLHDIHFRHLLNINEKIISDITEIKSDSLYLISNMATFMFYNNIRKAEEEDGDEELLDINKYLIIIKNPILSNLNNDIYKVKNDENQKLDNIMIVKFTNPNKDEISLEQTDLLESEYFEAIYTSPKIDEADNEKKIFETILQNLFKLNYFKEIDNRSISLLSMLDEGEKLQELYRYQFELKSIPTFVKFKKEPSENNQESNVTYDYKYNWSFYSTNNIVKQKKYFDYDNKSAFNLDTFDVPQLCNNYYEVNTQDDTKMIPAGIKDALHENCDPIDCSPAPSECKNKQDIYQDLCLRRNSEDSLYNLLIYFTNFPYLSSANKFFLPPENKLAPLMIYKYTDYNNEFDFFRILLFYKIFKYEKYNLQHISKISNIIDSLFTLITNVRQDILTNNYEFLDFIREKNENTKIVDIISLKIKFRNGILLELLKKEIGQILQYNSYQENLNKTSLTTLRIRNNKYRMSQIKDYNAWFYRCKLLRKDSTPSYEIKYPENPIDTKKTNKIEEFANKKETNKKEVTPNEIKIYIKFEKEDGILHIYLKVGDEANYELIYSDDESKELKTYSSKKKVLQVKDELNLILSSTKKTIDKLKKIKV